jgi:hypothetical protein
MALAETVDNTIAYIHKLEDQNAKLRTALEAALNAHHEALVLARMLIEQINKTS